MPIVRIDIKKNPDTTFARRIGEVIYTAMTATINVPANDNFQLLTEHDSHHFIYDTGYLGIGRTDGLVIIQITLSEGRSVEQKKDLYMAIAVGLHEGLGIRMEDVFINLVEVRKENWSFGKGLAQYAV